MAHPLTTQAGARSSGNLVRALIVAAAIVVAMLALNVIFGVQQAGPSYDLMPDPASLSGLPF